MYFVVKNSCADDPAWQDKVKKNYIRKVSKEKGVSSAFVKWISDKNVIHIRKKPRYVVEETFDVTLSFDVEVSGGKDPGKTSSKSRKEYGLTKTVSTKEDGFDKEDPLHGAGKAKENKDLYAKTDDETGENYMKICNGYEAADVEKVLAAALKQKKYFSHETEILRRSACEKAESEGMKLSEFGNTGIKVQPRPGSMNVYIDFDYQIEVQYYNKSYVAEVSENGSVGKVDVALSENNVKTYQAKLELCRNQKKVNVFCSAASGAIALIMFVCACAFGRDLEGFSAFRSVLGMPLSLLSLLFVAIDVAAILLYAKHVDRMLKNDDIEKSHVRAKAKSWMRTERLLMVFCGASWTFCGLFGVLQLIALVV